MTIWPVSECRVEFRLERRLPSSVRGPVEWSALSLFCAYWTGSMWFLFSAVVRNEKGPGCGPDPVIR